MKINSQYNKLLGNKEIDAKGKAHSTKCLHKEIGATSN